MTHNSSPRFESIRYEISIAKRERRQAEMKWRNTKLTIFKDLYRQAKHEDSKLVQTAKCKLYTEGIASSFSFFLKKTKTRMTTIILYISISIRYAQHVVHNKTFHVILHNI